MEAVFKKQAVVCLSGGLDSTVSLAMALSTQWKIVKAITFDYGQRANEQELKAAREIAEYYKIPHQTIGLPWYQSLSKGGSLIHRDRQIPKLSYETLFDAEHTQQSARQVWVPNRNGVFIEIAAAIAEDLEAQVVLMGFNREEATTFLDNSKDYIDAVNRALSFSTRNRIKVLAPTALLDKSEIIREGERLKIPFELVWSCYDGDAIMCGVCESCMRFKRALMVTYGKILYVPFKDSYFE